MSVLIIGSNTDIKIFLVIGDGMNGGGMRGGGMNGGGMRGGGMRGGGMRGGGMNGGNYNNSMGNYNNAGKTTPIWYEFKLANQAN